MSQLPWPVIGIAPSLDTFESRRITPANRITSTFTRPHHPGLCTRDHGASGNKKCRRCLLVEEEVPLGDILDSTSLAKTVGLVPPRLDPYISSFGWRYRDEKPKLYLLVTLVCLDTTKTCLSGPLRTQSGGPYIISDWPWRRSSTRRYLNCSWSARSRMTSPNLSPAMWDRRILLRSDIRDGWCVSHVKAEPRRRRPAV
ncbi:hypothetical protein BS50DRAFT_98368 [Corynespora cassiicola Philippines]|uniref:Uncharacterized protein n=1 Tax=Corynespora cassiicola Philippines TaxID=1448308 RepID=A0A2T2NFB3_CORCC|nr:hypothetical protein BS50DRAFT_98368 [Corynespora cassiicola Philippines]